MATKNDGPKERLDLALVHRGLVESREKAQRLIMAGEIRINGHPALKASTPVSAIDQLTCTQTERYVSRGGFKLEAGLAAFNLSPAGLRCLDIGASTGGFTDCLLQHGALEVVALDVGHGQLAWKLRQDPRVTVVEKANARQLNPEEWGGQVDAIVMDVSFISITLILPEAFRVLAPTGWLCVLIKPQFEAGRSEIGKGGIVRDPAVHDQVLQRLSTWLAARHPAVQPLGIVPSPLLGTEGNKEFLWGLRKT